MFIDQLCSLKGNYLLKWNDLVLTKFYTIKITKTPRWFFELETILLPNPRSSQKIHPQWIATTTLLHSCHFSTPDINSQIKDWICIWDSTLQHHIFGRVADKKDNLIIIQHWHHFITNSNVSPSLCKNILRKCEGCNINQQSLNRPLLQYIHIREFIIICLL